MGSGKIMELRRIFLAGFLIMLVWVIWGAFFTSQPNIQTPPPNNQSSSVKNNDKGNEDPYKEAPFYGSGSNNSSVSWSPIEFKVKTGLFSADLSNNLGGTFLQYTLNEEKYKGAYTERSSGFDKESKKHSYDVVAPVSFLFTEKEGYPACNPCLKNYTPSSAHDIFIDGKAVVDTGSEFLVKKRTEIEFRSDDFIHKITIDPLSYMVLHEYEILSEDLKLNFPKVVWANGTRPSEKYGWLDDQNSYGMYLTKNEEDSDYLTGNLNEKEDALKFNGDLEWIASRNKYFVSAIVPHESSVRSGKIIPFLDSLFLDKYKYRGSIPSVYNIELDFENPSSFKFYSFLAPLEYSLIADSGIQGLDDIMTWGGAVLKPISKFILKITNFINSYLPWGGYALVLILFAFIVRVVAGPLTKLSLDSTRKMQEVQPIIKEIQDKYKDNPKKLQTKIMEAYKNHNVNPLSGCFLMLLQWPIMIPPFILFRSIIELRGEPLFGWIQDLSLPDYMFELPIHIPFLGIGNGYTGFGLLPLLMGITLYLTMKQSSGTMPQQNKTMLYTMNGMFVLLFNSFPAGLNLYYVVYNILNYLQQRKTTQNKK